MKLCVKRIYCSSCRLSVRAREEYANGLDRIICSKCGRAIRIGNGIFWRLPKEGELASRGLTGSHPVPKGKKTPLSNARKPARDVRTAGGRGRMR